MEQPEVPASGCAPSHSNPVLFDHTEAKEVPTACLKCRLISSLRLPDRTEGRGMGMQCGAKMTPETTSFEREEPACSWAASCIYMVVSML